MNYTILFVTLMLFTMVSGFSPVSSGVKMPNPAAVLCHELEGSYDLSGLCFMGEASIGSWTLFHAHNSTENESIPAAVVAYLEHDPMPPVGMSGGSSSVGPGNPASIYCDYMGGVENSLMLANNSKAVMCYFEDSSFIETWTLFLGPDHERNIKLTRVLRAHY